MTRLTIVCHAATEAVRAARFPADEDVDDPSILASPPMPPVKAARWLSGPERRATSTAGVLSRGADVAVDRDLRDWDVGRWSGRDVADLQRSEPAGLASWMGDPAAAPHGGESLLDLLARAAGWLDRQAARGGRTAAVTSPSVLRAAVVGVLAAGPAGFWRIDAHALCRAEFSHDGRRWLLRSLVPHGRGRPEASRGAGRDEAAEVP